MRAMQAEAFGGYGDLKLTDIPKPVVSDGRVLVHMTAAGVTPLDHTILSGHFPAAKPPLVLGNEGAGVIEDGGGEQYPNGSRVMFTGPYGVFENGTYAEAIGGSVGNAVTQLARALGAKHAISTTTSHAKAEYAAKSGFADVIDLTRETLVDGVRRITGGRGADIVIDGVAGATLGESLKTLAPGGCLVTLGYSAGRNSMIDVTDLIWKGASIKSFLLFSQPVTAWQASWAIIAGLLRAGEIKPVVAKILPLEKAADALEYLIDGRPFGRVILAI